jgi:hypothetical protein
LPIAKLKIIRATALAALAIATVVAAGGVSTASATTLCKENKELCPEAKRYPEAQIVNTTLQSLTTAQFEVGETKGFEWELAWEAWCEETSFVWKTSKREGEALTGTLTSASFGTCFPGMSCKPQMIHIPYKTDLRAYATDPGDGSLQLSDNGNGKPAVELKQCGPLGVTCTYEEGTLKIFLEALGGNPAEVSVENVVMFGAAGNGKACGPKVLFKTWYKVTSPEEAVFVTLKP